MTLRFVHEHTFCERLTEGADCQDTPLLRGLDRVFTKFEGLMEGNFLAPAAWPKLRSRPLALFGSVFSHADFDHISANLGALHLCRETESWLGTAKFAHLYLTSALVSRAFCIYWNNRDSNSKRVARSRMSLGASGAISGVMAWWCIECFKRGKSFVVKGRSISPLIVWALYVAIDASGLFKLGLVQSFLSRYLDELMGARQDDKVKERSAVPAAKKPPGEVGYDAHIGGAFAGVLWQAPSLLVRLVTRR